MNTTGFRQRVEQWNNPGYLEIFDRERPSASVRINRIAAAGQ